MIFYILWLFIIIFAVMLLVGIVRGKGRTKARSYETARENRKLAETREQLEQYKKDPESVSMTEDDFLYNCFVTDIPYKGYDLKKAHAFYTTCELRHINDIEGRKNLLASNEIFKMDKSEDFDLQEFFDLGERLTRIDINKKRIERADK